MDLISAQIITKKEGRETIEVAAGKHYKIEISPQGEEQLDYVVPAGKTAEIHTLVLITETDV